MLTELPAAEVQAIIDRALAEDIAWGDVTTRAIVPPDCRARAEAIAKRAGVLAGGEVFVQTFRTLDPDVRVDTLLPDGSRLEVGQVIVALEGRATAILSAERVALNFLQRMSGIATMTAAYVAALAGYPARLVDTRKTVPGLRLLDKYAVRVGGGSNHRYNLADAVLIKDNHLAIARRSGLGIAEVIRLVRQRVSPFLKIEVEVESPAEAAEAAEAGADLILLDNMPPAQMAEAVRAVAGRALVEASGGITLETIREVAATGVDLISSGSLTHSVRALDISLEIRT
ncbi:MAG TPA: carboxylating nicotinate-nucleotide diphosphorylase [Chloroflexota bacterium]|nr:carboxylating nicotinate-nucleotide diphosphorylase [Chloroflexota bacterium]